jgi:hypothetical protein
MLEIFDIECMRVFFEGATLTSGFGPAEFFAGSDQQCVVLVEKLNIIGEIRLEQFPQLLIIGARIYQFVP